MNEKKDVKLSAFKQKVLLWKLKRGKLAPCSDQSELINAVSEKTFRKYAPFFLKKGTEETLAPLLYEENKEKFRAAAQCSTDEHFEFFFLMLHKAANEQLLEYLSFAKLGDDRLYDIFERRGEEIFSLYIKEHTLSNAILLKLVQYGKPGLLLLYFNDQL